jgi:hypothetical protein
MLFGPKAGTWPAGTSLVGPQGATGPAGPTGATGPQGPAGPVAIQGTATANQFATFYNGTTIQGVAITGLVKGNGASAPAAAVAGTDYLAPPSGTAIQKANSGGALAPAVAGTDYAAPTPGGTAILKANNAGGFANAVAGTDYQAADPQLSSNIRQNSQSVNYTTVLADGEKHILHPASDNNARTFTIDSNANVAFPIGTAITFVNKINTVTIAITADTLTLAGLGSAGSRTLAANGMATAIKIATTEWMISGSGLT